MKPNFYLKFSLLLTILCFPILGWGQVYRVEFGFNTGTGFNRLISDKVVQPDGKVIVCGRFTTVNGVPRSSLVRLNQNGSVDTSFIPRIDSPLMAYPPLDVKVKVGLQSNGKVIVAGVFNTSFDNSYSTRTLRANIDGTLDTTFQTTISLPQMANPHFSIMKVMPDNSILIGGFEVDINAPSNHLFYSNFWPMHENGLTNITLQEALEVIGDVKCIEGLPNGKILLGGNLQTFRGRVVSNLVQFNADYTLDTTFNYRSFRDTTGYISDVKVLPNGKLVTLGNFTSYNGTPCKNIALLNSNGVLDSLNSTLGSGFNNEVTSMMLQPDGKLILGGTFTTYNGVSVPKLIRVYPNGNLDTTFRPDAAFLGRVQNPVYTLMSDGNILVSGRISADTNTHIWKLTFEPCSSVVAPSVTGEASFCQGGYTTLSSSAAIGNLWSTGDTTRSINVAQPGSYSVRAISATCTTANSNTISVVDRGPSPTVINIDTTTSRCQGTRIQLTPAGNYAHYLWSNGETTRSIYTRTTGQYSVQVANVDSCFGLPSPPVYIAFDTVWCTVQISRIGIDSITANVWADYYIWYLDGIELLSSNTLKTIPIQGNGVYTFRAVNGTRMSRPSNPIIITSSKKSFATTKFEIFPNPATDKVTIKTTGSGTLEIINTLGQLVNKQTATETNEINLSKLAKGVYTVRFNGASKILVVK